MSGKKIIRYIPVGIIVVLIVVLFLANVKSDDFFKASFSTCISLGTAVVISFLLTQRMNDERKQKDILLQLLADLQKQITDEAAYKIKCNTEREGLLLRMREINNKLDILGKFGEKYGIGKDVVFLQEKFTEYSNLISDYIEAIPQLSSMEKSLRRPLELMDARFFEIMLQLYD